MSAKRADAVVPTKPTKYDEAVKSVQEWNEALKQPSNSSFLRTNRQSVHSSAQRKVRNIAKPNNGFISKANLNTSKSAPNTDKFRSTEAEVCDNWDNDFVTSISPSALQLRQFKPHDNFAGAFSSDKLKSYATIDTVTEEFCVDELADGEETLKSPIYRNKRSSDLPRLTQYQSASTKSTSLRSSKAYSQGTYQDTQTTPVVTGIPVSKRRLSSGRTRPTNVYRENSVEDYSDLIAADDAAFQKKLQAMQVEYHLLYSKPPN